MRGRIPLVLFLAMLAGLALVPAPGTAAEGILDSKTARLLEAAARDLAAAGLRDATTASIDVLRRLGRPAATLRRLESTCEKALARARPSATREKTARRKVEQAIRALEEILVEASGDARPLLARQILRLDDGCAAAREALGHTREDGRWLSPRKAAAIEGRDRIQRAIASAERRKFETTHGDSDREIIAKACGRPAKRVAWSNVDVHGPFEQGRLERILVRALRARTLSQEVLLGKPDLAKVRNPKTFLLVDSVVAYERAIELAVGEGKLTAAQAEGARQMTSFWYDRPGRSLVAMVDTEANILSILVYHLFDWRWASPVRGKPIQPCLATGHLNWLCLTSFGTSMPGVGRSDSMDTASAQGAGSTALGPAERRRRETKLRLARAGILGCRSWMAYLAERREDPPWSDAMKEYDTDIRGLVLLKTTMVVAYLQEIGRFAAMVEASARPNRGDAVPSGAAIFEEALGEPLLPFEESWRSWIVEERPGVLQRLDGAGVTALTEGEAAAAGALRTIRRAALEPRSMEEFVDVLVLPELSAGALAHARYLSTNPEQMAKWPDAHEEWPDREGYSVAGSGAGLRSVIAPDARRPEDAIASWMATFYHRLPLLAAGLRGIGWGHEKGIAVLDVGSMVEPWETDVSFVLWPHDKMKNVPRRFQSELPNPVPGESQAAWGYPVTIQGGLWDQRLTMKLYVKKPEPGNEVEAHLSTPWEPTNRELAPDGAACLIPKAPLEANTTYTVVVEHLPKGESLMWTFRTGR